MFGFSRNRCSASPEYATHDPRLEMHGWRAFETTRAYFCHGDCHLVVVQRLDLSGHGTFFIVRPIRKLFPRVAYFQACAEQQLRSCPDGSLALLESPSRLQGAPRHRIQAMRNGVATFAGEREC